MTLFHSGTLRGGCPVCGEPHTTCGGPSDAVPVDERMEVAVVGGPLKKYEITLPSGAKTVMKLNEADARRWGVAEAAAEPERDADGPEEAPEVTHKARRPASRAKGGRSSDPAS